MQITRQAHLTEQQFLGCVSAFVDALAGELNSAAMYLRKLDGAGKGAAFAFEMSLDRHRYGALTVLDRWSTLVAAFGPHVKLGRYQQIIDEAPARVTAAETMLTRANELIDAAESYSTEVIEAALLAWQAVAATFAEEYRSADQSAKLGPMLPDEFKEARATFLRDLSAR